MDRSESSAAIKFKEGQTVVIKVGTSSLLMNDLNAINLPAIANLCETVARLAQGGCRVVMVTSGAVGVGGQVLGLKTRPTDLPKKQALAAIGQQALMRYYNDFLSALGLSCAQVLLTLDNLANRSQYLNARNTFQALFEYGTIPIVNENDTVAVQELRIGDNDTLSAQVASLVGADWLFLLTDVAGLYTANPQSDPEAKLIPVVDDLAQLNVNVGDAGSSWGTGGMHTKLTAARIAVAAGCRMVICLTECLVHIPTVVLDTPVDAETAGLSFGTLFLPLENPLRGRKRWILGMPSRGQIHLDEGASRAILKRKSLFPAGVRLVQGSFHAQDRVSIVDSDGTEMACGLTNYSSEEVMKIQGKTSAEIKEYLGYFGNDEVVHRDNLCITMVVPGSEGTKSMFYAKQQTLPEAHGESEV
ncbi:hypothetical protein CYMTET_39702 [Cymbomonas tetramitiformis]|uniref:PUA domain-containing protein n=1 Tax=Cymbomonas tetramitiformis TaxID=36881 RepID=A0AAE0F3P6_9CHLO|nr:hypothetical protein CYMTET_39702 [Cymbomonas tetramitiformis]